MWILRRLPVILAVFIVIAPVGDLANAQSAQVHVESQFAQPSHTKTQVFVRGGAILDLPDMRLDHAQSSSVG